MTLLAFIFIFLISFLNAKNNNINLTNEEELFLQNNQPLRLHNEAYWPPYNFNENDTPKGFVIDSYFSILGSDDETRIELYVGNSLVKEWTPPSGYFGNSINSPFNYNSWKFESIEPTGNNVVGKIIFTITNEDIE